MILQDTIDNICASTKNTFTLLFRQRFIMIQKRHFLIYCALIGYSVVCYAQQPLQFNNKDFYSIRINGEQVGFRATCTIEKNNLYKTEMLEVMYINRAGNILRVITKEIYNETINGKPISFQIDKKMPNHSLCYSGQIQNNEMRLVANQLGKSNEVIYPWDKNALFPKAFIRHQKNKGFRSGTTYTTKQYFPGIDLSRAIETKHTIIGPEKTTIMDKNIEAIKVERIISGFDSYPQYEWVDSDGNLLKAHVDFKGTKIDTILCSKREALSVDFLNLPEVFAKTLTPVPQEFRDRERIKKITLAIQATNKTEGFTIPVSVSQKAHIEDDVLIIELLEHQSPVNLAITLNQESAYRKANTFIDYHDPNIVDLVDRAGISNCSPWSKAKKLVGYVNRLIKTKDLSTSIATASEISRQLQGDCTEHAILLAALLRAVGLPSRVVCGLQYIPQYSDETDMWGGHMWTQVNINNQWYDLDASLGQVGSRFDRIAFSCSSLEEGFSETKIMFPLILIEGKRNIEVISVQHKE
ncbi:MAG: hypothetical protein DRZ76_02440 [Candidatus Nealsonbacteria bacterium]|nr:MAG: hypothetical protein DRZ76_02440 [Candidatus Nealsonbacteria bacterium]